MSISDDRYERLMLLIFFEVIAIILFITLFHRLSTDLQKFIFFYAIVVLQLPFLSFIQNDFLSRRPTLVEKLTKIFINILIFGVVIGIFVIIFLVDYRSGIVSTLVTIIFLIIQNKRKIESWLKAKKNKKK